MAVPSPPLQSHLLNHDPWYAEDLPQLLDLLIYFNKFKIIDFRIIIKAVITECVNEAKYWSCSKNDSFGSIFAF